MPKTIKGEPAVPKPQAAPAAPVDHLASLRGTDYWKQIGPAGQQHLESLTPEQQQSIAGAFSGAGQAMSPSGFGSPYSGLQDIMKGYGVYGQKGVIPGALSSLSSFGGIGSFLFGHKPSDPQAAGAGAGAAGAPGAAQPTIMDQVNSLLAQIQNPMGNQLYLNNVLKPVAQGLMSQEQQANQTAATGAQMEQSALSHITDPGVKAFFASQIPQQQNLTQQLNRSLTGEQVAAPALNMLLQSASGTQADLKTLAQELARAASYQSAVDFSGQSGGIPGLSSILGGQGGTTAPGATVQSLVAQNAQQAQQGVTKTGG